MKLHLVLVAAVALAPIVFVESREVRPFLRGTVDDAEDAAAVSDTFFLGSIRPRPDLTARAMKLPVHRIAPVKFASAEDSGVRELRKDNKKKDNKKDNKKKKGGNKEKNEKKKIDKKKIEVKPEKIELKVVPTKKNEETKNDEYQLFQKKGAMQLATSVDWKTKGEQLATKDQDTTPKQTIIKNATKNNKNQGWSFGGIIDGAVGWIANQWDKVFYNSKNTSKNMSLCGKLDACGGALGGSNKANFKDQHKAKLSNEEELKKAIESGPVSIAIEADQMSFEKKAAPAAAALANADRAKAKADGANAMKAAVKAKDEFAAAGFRDGEKIELIEVGRGEAIALDRITDSVEKTEREPEVVKFVDNATDTQKADPKGKGFIGSIVGWASGLWSNLTSNGGHHRNLRNGNIKSG